MDTLDIAVLLVFAVMAGVGVCTQPRGNSTASDWLSRLGILGALVWMGWIFLRPGGENAHNVIQMFHDFFAQ